MANRFYLSDNERDCAAAALKEAIDWQSELPKRVKRLAKKDFAFPWGVATCPSCRSALEKLERKRK